MRHLSVLLFCLMFASAAMAQDMPASKTPEAAGTPTLMLKQYKPSHPERVLMAFNKVAGLQPDFLQWAQQSPFLKDAKEVDRDAIISRESNRLSQSYSTFDSTDPLIVHANIHLDNYSTIQEILSLSEFTPKTFFSFSIYGQNVAIVPKDIGNFGKIAITKTEMDEMLQKAGAGTVKAELLLKPVVGDAKTPFVQNNVNYWLLLSEIAEIRFWGSGAEPKLLWMYRADWYKPKEDKALMDLKGGM